MRRIFKNFSYTFIGNFITFLLNAGVTFIIPKFIGVTEYSYYQLFQFYIAYVGYMQFGWVDGMYLRLGGRYYEDLDKKRLHTQWCLYTIFTLIVGGVVILSAFLGAFDKQKQLVIFLTGLSVFNILPITWFQYILQATNRIKENATVIILRSVLFLIGICVLLLLRVTGYAAFCIAFVIAQFFSLLYVLWACRDIVCNKKVPVRSVIGEIKQDFSQGIKLTIATVSSVLIIGVVRLAIEQSWSVETFGKVSLTLSVSNLLMLFVRAVSLVMFPALRRTREENLAEIYGTMRTGLMVVLLGLLVGYYPLKVILSAWLPQYADSLVYMALLFPMCVFESKTSMLIETYMKTLRKEKWLLTVNLATVFLSVVFAVITVYWLHNLDLAVVSIVVLLAFRCIAAECLLSRLIGIEVKKDILLEVILTAIFIVASWFVGGVPGIVLYAAAYVVYLLIKRDSITNLLHTLKAKLKPTL